MLFKLSALALISGKKEGKMSPHFLQLNALLFRMKDRGFDGYK